MIALYRLSIKWLKRAEYNKQTFLPSLQREVGATCCTRRDCEKNGLDIEPKPFLALFVFCSGAVPLYSSHSQNTKFISLSQSLPAYFVLKLSFFFFLLFFEKNELFHREENYHLYKACCKACNSSCKTV